MESIVNHIYLLKKYLVFLRKTAVIIIVYAYFGFGNIYAQPSDKHRFEAQIMLLNSCTTSGEVAISDVQLTINGMSQRVDSRFNDVVEFEFDNLPNTVTISALNEQTCCGPRTAILCEDGYSGERVSRDYNLSTCTRITNFEYIINDDFGGTMLINYIPPRLTQPTMTGSNLDGQNVCGTATLSTSSFSSPIIWEVSASSPSSGFRELAEGSNRQSVSYQDLVNLGFNPATSVFYFRATPRNCISAPATDLRSLASIPYTFYPERPTVIVPRTESPTCPNYDDGQIIVSSIRGSATEYAFTLCSENNSGDPLVCYNFTRTKSVANWRVQGITIDNSILSVQTVISDGTTSSNVPIPIGSGRYSLIVEANTPIDACFRKVENIIVDRRILTVSNASGSVLTCLGGSDGTIEVTVENGVGDYTVYAHNASDFSDTPIASATFSKAAPPAGSTTGTLTNLSEGTYYLRATDSCSPNQTAFYGPSTAGTMVTVATPSSPFGIVGASTSGVATLCNSSATGSAEVTVENRFGSVIYELLDATDTPVETSTAQNANTYIFTTTHSSGNYTVRVTDGNGCEASYGVSIEEIAALGVTISPSTGEDIVCRGAGNGRITIDATGGSGSYDYSIDGGSTWQSSNIFESLDSASYTLAVRDANYTSCSYVHPTTVDIDQPNSSVAIESLEETNSLACFGDDDGELTVVATGGTPDVDRYTFILYEWDAPSSMYLEVDQATARSPHTFTGRFAAEYRVEVRDANGSNFGCSATADIELGQPDELGIQSAEVKRYLGDDNGTYNIRCYGESNGEITVTTEGGIYPHDVTIDGTTETIAVMGESVTFIGLTAGTYTIYVSDANGCPYDEDIELTEPDELLINEPIALTYVGDWNISCHGEADGEVTVTTTGGVWPHTVTMNGEDKEITATTPSVTFDSLSAQTYTIAITDANGCTDTREITLTEPEEFEVTSMITPTYFGGYHLRCRGDNDAETTIRTAGGTYPHEVTVGLVTETINSPTESAIFSNLSAGNYSVAILDANGCTNTASFTLTQPDELRLDATQTVIVQPECFGDNTASLTLQAIGGVEINGSGYRYEIDHQNVPPDLPFVFEAHQEQEGTKVTFENLIAGEYLVSVYDHFGRIGILGAMNGCLYQETIEITTINQLTIDLQTTDITCKDDTNGGATLLLTGGSSPYTVIWQDQYRQPIETDVIATGERAVLENRGEGLYYFRVTDASGCEYYQSGLNLTIEGPANPLELTVNQRDITCYGDNNGLVQLQATGGWQEMAYEFGTDLSSLSVGNTFYENLTPGTTTYYVRDSRGCVASTTITITEPAELRLEAASVTMITCHGENDGQIQLVASGGRTPYAYTLDQVNYQSSPTFANLLAGTYTLQVQDSSGCVANHVVTLTQPDLLQADVINIANTRCGENGGSANSSVVGGTMPYTYRWYNAANELEGTSPTINNLFGDTYRLEVEDANGCIQSTPFTILNTNDIRIEVTDVQPVSCFGGNDGSIDITILQSTPPVTISWSNGATTEDVTGLTAGSYTVTLSDAAGCEITETIAIASPEPLALTIIENQSPTCHQGCDGQLTVMATGGIAPYTYLWPASGSTTPQLTSQCAGSYEVEVTDSNGCSYQQLVTIAETEAIAIDLGGSSTICAGQEVTLDAGAWESYLWSMENDTITTTQNITLTAAGTYRLQVTDADGCVGEDSYEVIISNDILDADFLLPTEGYVGDTIVCIDITWPLVDQVSWEYDELAFASLRTTEAYKDLKLLTAGTHTITMHASLGGCEDEQAYEIVVSELSGRAAAGGRLGYTESGIKEFTVYPNPNAGKFRSMVSLHEAGDISLRLISIYTGKAVYSYKGVGQEDYSVPIVLPALPQGIYALQLEAAGQTETVRVFVE